MAHRVLRLRQASHGRSLRGGWAADADADAARGEPAEPLDMAVFAEVVIVAERSKAVVRLGSGCGLSRAIDPGRMGCGGAMVG